MSEWFPERPVLFYPSLAQRYGADEALLLSIIDDVFRQHSMSDGSTEVLLLAPNQYQALTPFWSHERLSETLHSLDRQRLLQASWGKNGTLKVLRHQSDLSGEGMSVTQPNPLPNPQTSSQPVADSSPVPSSSLPVYDNPPPVTAEIQRRRSPAPMFGGNAGWRRGKDELQQIFDRHEERNLRMVAMTMGWKPSAAFYDMLSRQSITAAYAEQCLDEFVLYWLDKDRKETNWDQKFLAWVKREWVHKQSREASGRSNEQQPVSGQAHENTRRDTRENRKRVTASIMDIEDTNW